MTSINAKPLAFQDQQIAENLFIRDWHVNSFVPDISAAEQLAADVDTLKQVAGGDVPDTLGFWSSQPALVVSVAETRLPNYKSACEQLKQQGWTVLPRLTGGTAFPQTIGVINVSAVCALTQQQRSIKISYQDFCKVLTKALASLGIDSVTGAQPQAFCDGDYNILVDGKKVIGTAQRWQRSALLAHAAIFFSVDKATINDTVNSFYKLAGSDKRFDPDALVDLRSCVDLLQVSDLCAALETSFCH